MGTMEIGVFILHFGRGHCFNSGWIVTQRTKQSRNSCIRLTRDLTLNPRRLTQLTFGCSYRTQRIIFRFSEMPRILVRDATRPDPTRPGRPEAARRARGQSPGISGWPLSRRGYHLVIGPRTCSRSP